MSATLERLYARYLAVMAQQTMDPADLDYRVLERHIALLDQLDVIETSSISIFDLYQQKHVYYSRKHVALYGWNLEEAYEDAFRYSDRRKHPEDVELHLEAGTALLAYCFQLPLEVRKDYKVILDYRTLSPGGQYIRVVEQQSVLELDQKGHFWLALCLLDRSPDPEVTRPASACLLNYRTGETWQLPLEPESSLPLSSREREIVQMVSTGLASKEIAERLYISVHTVNTHRQRIIEKLNVSNMVEAVAYAHQAGLLTATLAPLPL
jgi:DNA-binding CsgD family transcriptional regulator